MRQLDFFSEFELNKNELDKRHNFVRRTTKSENAELFICTKCGASKNILNKDSKCHERAKPFSIERFLNAT